MSVRKVKEKRRSEPEPTESDLPINEAKLQTPPSNDGVVNTPYDDVFKALALYCVKLLLFL